LLKRKANRISWDGGSHDPLARLPNRGCRFHAGRKAGFSRFRNLQMTAGTSWRFPLDFVLKWFAVMSGSLSVAFMIISEVAGYRISFSWAGWIGIAVTGALFWFREHRHVLNAQGERFKRQTILDLTAMIVSGQELERFHPVVAGQVQPYAAAIKTWAQALQEFIDRVFPEHGSSFRAVGTVDRREQIRTHIALLESLRETIRSSPALAN
jgi:hypothetical protein